MLPPKNILSVLRGHLVGSEATMERYLGDIKLRFLHFSVWEGSSPPPLTEGNPDTSLQFVVWVFVSS